MAMGKRLSRAFRRSVFWGSAVYREQPGRALVHAPETEVEPVLGGAEMRQRRSPRPRHVNAVVEQLDEVAETGKGGGKESQARVSTTE